MPSRYVREGWIDSDRVRSVGDAAEVMLLRLILVVDDFATFDGRLTVIQRRCWPAGDDEPGLPAPSIEEIEKRLQMLVSKSLVFRYEVGGKPFVFIPNFQQRTRAKKSKYPLPPGYDGHMSGISPTDDGQVSGRWRTPDGHVTDAGPTHDGGPQAGSSSSSGLSTKATVSRDDRKTEPVDKSSRKVQGGLTTSIPVAPQPPHVTPGTGDLKPPAAMTPAEREARGITPPPADLVERFTKPANGAAPFKPNGRRTLEREPRDPDEPTDDELIERARTPMTVAAATQILNATPQAGWDETPEAIDQAGQTLGMKRLPFEEDQDFAKRIEARIALG